MIFSDIILIKERVFMIRNEQIKDNNEHKRHIIKKKIIEIKKATIKISKTLLLF